MSTFEEIQKANSTLSTMDIKGKDYVLVNERIRAFRMLHPDGCIVTEMLSNVDGVCVFRATVMDESGATLGTGHAYEKESSSYINKTSYIENCETSAVGRALGMCGIGIDTAVASYEEVQNAVNNQEPAMPADGIPMISEKQTNYIKKMCKESESQKLKASAYISSLGFEKLNQLTMNQASELISRLKEV